PSPTQLYTLSLHDALPISTQANNTPRRDVGTANPRSSNQVATQPRSTNNTVRPSENSQVNTPRSNNQVAVKPREATNTVRPRGRSEEHTSELQSRENLVCR